MKFTVSPTLGEDVARQILLPAVRRATDNVEGHAKQYAPPAKVWITARDEKVRPTHVATDEQTIPDNLRYKVPKTVGVGVDLARVPRDPALPIGNSINCRCMSVPVPRAVADSIRKSNVTVYGARVTAEVSTRFPRAAESEFGTSDDDAARFFGRALNTAAARSPGFRAVGT